MENSYHIVVKKLVVKRPHINLRGNGRIILTWVLQKQFNIIFSWLRAGSSKHNIESSDSMKDIGIGT